MKGNERAQENNGDRKGVRREKVRTRQKEGTRKVAQTTEKAGKLKDERERNRNGQKPAKKLEER